jgi:hypothetical protein
LATPSRRSLPAWEASNPLPLLPIETRFFGWSWGREKHLRDSEKIRLDCVQQDRNHSFTILSL